jgi:hypothetical protein
MGCGHGACGHCLHDKFTTYWEAGFNGKITTMGLASLKQTDSSMLETDCSLSTTLSHR